MVLECEGIMNIRQKGDMMIILMHECLKDDIDVTGRVKGWQDIWMIGERITIMMHELLTIKHE